MFPSSPKRRRTMTGQAEDVANLIKFYGMQKQDDQSMSSFCEDLRLQAEKCGGKSCCVKQKIRERFTLADEGLIVELAVKTNSSISDVLAAEDRIENECHLRTLILPHLSLAEIAAIFYASVRLKKVVGAYLRGKVSVTLSGELLAQYPIEGNKEFYSSIVYAEYVTLNSVEENNLAKALSIFNSIERLTLVKMNIIDKVDYFPDQLRELSLVDVQIDEELLQEWLGKLNETLLSLQLDSIATRFTQSKEIDLQLEDSCPNLQSLTLIGGTIEFTANPNNLQSLHIEAGEECCEIEAYIQLETLHLAVPKSTSVDWKKFTKLRSLTMNHWPGTVPQSVEDLRIIYPQDPKHRPQIEALKELKTVQISYHPQEEEEQDLILNKMNPDCLLELIKYLSLKDRISFANTHSKLFKLITENCCRKMIMIESNVEFLKDNTLFCKRAAPYIRDLTIKEKCDDVHWIVPLCTALEELLFESVDPTTDFINSWPRELLWFRLQYKRDTDDLRVQQALGRYFGKLTDLEGFGFDCTIAEDALKDCFERNQDTLKSIVLYYNGDDATLKDYDWTWASSALLPKVDQLHLGYQSRDDPLEPQHMKSMLSSLGRQLIELNVEIGLEDFGEAINGRLLPHLEQLTLTMYLDEEVALAAVDRSGLTSLVKLKRLSLEMDSLFETFELTDDDVWDLIKSLPELEHLRIDGFQSSLRFQKELKDYIKTQGRNLVFNSHRF